MRSTWRLCLGLTLICLTVHASIARSSNWTQPSRDHRSTAPQARRSSWSQPIAVRPSHVPVRHTSRRVVAAEPSPLVTLQAPIPLRRAASAGGIVARGQSEELPAPTAEPPQANSPVMLDFPRTMIAQPRPGRRMVRSGPVQYDCGSPLPWGDGQAWGCDSSCAGDCEDWDVWSGLQNRWYVSAEYLLWNVSEDSTPPLVTLGVTSPTNVVPGALGQPSSFVIFGGDQDLETQSGGRFRAGLWFNPEHSLGIEGSYFFLQEETNSFAAGSMGAPLLAVPFLNANTGLEDRVLLASPGTQVGSVLAEYDNRFWGTELNLRTNFMFGPNAHLDFLAGFRQTGLEESLGLFTDTTTTATANRVQTWDQFSTRNHFYGGQVGAHAEYRCGRWSIELTGKVAVGNTYQSVNVVGNRIATDGAGMMTAQTGGIFAQQSNIGHRSRNDFAVVPEFGLKVGLQLRSWLRATAGYNFIYWSSVVRPGDQIDRTLNLTQQTGMNTGVARPAVQFNDTDFWVQGLTGGLEIRW